ncbi:rhodanese-like domain-containing protein [Varunaivibrio sulfuroxidans]|uniref:Thiosulfate/3-mercaptopyruvate sulfurtransferase n=1 Tax=Varunaivibrio sulfuroxidans TaxID=1773489 RepID=A0A4R3J5N2_9PROT|nr:rhodanese-like domain-containing protein [Varunaivibrio sulfuroxidans]TCS60602.1 thiosulfate/3-mercaptopyruvate sulfurtransferase [Varunaivibrio sulfuroxidans]WES30092.1 rhodanese-like domain-containing protein [Varunaivibrio sulfuroxidans]
MDHAIGARLRTITKKQRQIALLLVFGAVVTLSHIFVLGAVIVLSHAERASGEPPTAKPHKKPETSPRLGLFQSNLFYLTALPALSTRSDLRIIDTRATDQCEKASLPGAACLAPRDLFGPGGRLATFSDIRWLLGALGLDGTHEALVVGDDARARDIVAGALYLAGQNRVAVVNTPLPHARLGAGGDTRSMTRDVVYTAPMRDRAIVTHEELRRLIAGGAAQTAPPALIDGRTEEAYWGRRFATQRGGHIPGADNVPVSTPRLTGPGAPILTARRPLIVYGDDPAQGLALLARFKGAPTPADARPRDAGPIADIAVYLDGWSRWASDPTLPVDAAAYGDAPTPKNEHTRNPA